MHVKILDNLDSIPPNYKKIISATREYDKSIWMRCNDDPIIICNESTGLVVSILMEDNGKNGITGLDDAVRIADEKQKERERLAKVLDRIGNDVCPPKNKCIERKRYKPMFGALMTYIFSGECVHITAELTKDNVIELGRFYDIVPNIVAMDYNNYRFIFSNQYRETMTLDPSYTETPDGTLTMFAVKISIPISEPYSTARVIEILDQLKPEMPVEIYVGDDVTQCLSGGSREIRDHITNEWNFGSD